MNRSIWQANQGIGETGIGNRGIVELGNWGTGELGNREPGTGEPGNRGTGEPGNWGTGESGNFGFPCLGKSVLPPFATCGLVSLTHLPSRQTTCAEKARVMALADVGAGKPLSPSPPPSLLRNRERGNSPNRGERNPFFLVSGHTSLSDTFPQEFAKNGRMGPLSARAGKRRGNGR